jgi:glutamate synthase domain-containing protein 3
MSGGIAYVLDASGMFAERCNPAMVKLERVVPVSEQSSDEPWHRNTADEVLLKGLIETHFAHTGSVVARGILDDWEAARTKFVKVFPDEYRRALGELAAKQQEQLEAA